VRRVVVTGLGAVTPCGADVPTTWDSMLAGRSGTGPLTRFPCDGFPCRVAGQVDDFDAEARLGARSIRRLGRFMQFALAACDEAIAHAGFVVGAPLPDGDRVATYVGTGIGGLPEIVEGMDDFARDGHKGVSPFFIPRSLNNLATGQIAIRYGARGPSLCISTACAVGNHSIGEAWRCVRDGDADLALAGGTEASLTPVGFAGFQSMKALSSRNDDPTRASRPFDRNRDGFVMGEGAGVVVLEELDHALARGARILAEVVGYGATTDAHHVTAPAPGGDGAVRAMARALAVGGLSPSDVQYINAHGTSTPLNDKTETEAIRGLFGAHADRLMVSSTKGVTGHLLGAAGGVEAVATVMTLVEGRVPPTANYQDPDPECDLDYVPEGARRADVRVALSNGFGFGGTNATLAFRRWEGA
jgi:3-oxoacyl-[acyl-carrier-protein] synthase II